MAKADVRGTALRVYLRVLGEVYKQYLHLYVTTDEAMVNTERVTLTLSRRMYDRVLSGYASYTLVTAFMLAQPSGRTQHVVTDAKAPPDGRPAADAEDLSALVLSAERRAWKQSGGARHDAPHRRDRTAPARGRQRPL
jgi:hypothetical protein